MERKQFIKSIGLSTLAMNLHLDNLRALERLGESLPATSRMPVLFLGHGSPMNAIEDNEFSRGISVISTQIPKPHAILCISAHWFTRGTYVTAMDHPRTIHDFGGFPKELYEVQYPAPGHPTLANETIVLLQPDKVHADLSWGLDHGTWSVLIHLFPKADVPVIQLSIDYSKHPEYHFALAQKLNSLRNKGVLIVGSGNIVHNLGLVDFQNFESDNYGFDWAIEAREKVNNYLQNRNFTPLLDYQKLGKSLELAVPTPDHYLPLIYILGQILQNENLEIFNDKMVAGSLSMTSLFCH